MCASYTGAVATLGFWPHNIYHTVGYKLCGEKNCDSSKPVEFTTTKSCRCGGGTYLLTAKATGQYDCGFSGRDSMIEAAKNTQNGESGSWHRGDGGCNSWFAPSKLTLFNICSTGSRNADSPDFIDTTSVISTNKYIQISLSGKCV